jgi:hypothetical protein
VFAAAFNEREGAVLEAGKDVNTEDSGTLSRRWLKKSLGRPAKGKLARF